MRTVGIVGSGLVLMIAAVLGVGIAPADAFAAVEGEARTNDAGQCAPDGERMLVRFGDASGGAALEFPNDGCWAEWTVNVNQPALGVFIQSLPPTGGFSGVLECVVWTLKVDGNILGATLPHCGQFGVGVPALLPIAVNVNLNLLPISAGQHTFRATSNFVVGPSWANAYVDFVSFDNQLFNLLPIADPAAFTAGLLDQVQNKITFDGSGSTAPSGGLSFEWTGDVSFENPLAAITKGCVPGTSSVPVKLAVQDGTYSSHKTIQVKGPIPVPCLL